jgi:hypothetical protein
MKNNSRHQDEEESSKKKKKKVLFLKRTPAPVRRRCREKEAHLSSGRTEKSCTS